MSLYDPIVRHRAIEKLVTRSAGDAHERKYWRFRVDRWYGGIVTADAVGCGLLCKFCWVSDRIMMRPGEVGKFYNPETVARTLIEMAGKKGIRRVRVSGGEPTIGKDHLLQVLEGLKKQGLVFILETNGILIGEDKSYAHELAEFPFAHVRVSLKGCSEEEFSSLTGAKQEGFLLQLKALQNLVRENVHCHPAVMVSFSPENSLQRLIERIRAIEPKLVELLETEELILYPSVKTKVRKHGLRYYRSYVPSHVPKELI
jgi:uncharacterized Fe-S cluster-containing radical SAM superfamily protein